MFDDLLTALKATNIPFAAYDWDRAPQSGSYGTIDIDGGTAAAYGNDGLLEQGITGTVDLYVRGTGTTDKDAVEAVLDAQGVAYELYSVQHDREVKAVHYQWAYELEEQ